MSAEILPTDTPERFRAAVERAAQWLRAGQPVALPTETVYGLAANALDAAAVARLYQIKGRPAHNPIIVHVAGVEMARQCVAEWPEAAEQLARAFWPGPLTLVLPRAPVIPDVVTAGGPTVGVRWPRHPFMQAVIRACGFPLAAPSANLASRLSPTTAEHVRAHLGARIPLIVDGGPCPVGIESTVLDLTTRPPRVLRPGMIHAESLAAVLGAVVLGENAADASAGPLRSPGLLEKHYAPSVPLWLMHWRDDAELHRQLRALAPDQSRPLRVHLLVHTNIPTNAGNAGEASPVALERVAVIPRDPDAFARALYAELHRCEEAGAECIVVETPPAGPEWRAIADRLRRAAAGTTPVGPQRADA
ncbi:MAG: L-threonylcarbamoyladenylate synthase [Verrucomicrobiales bacterium]|nr:L-threonylcarbamoyladenylate synthase [Verrucomicrobiales bacterium]